MKIKRILIGLLLFSLCGCTCEYNLKINSDSYEEKLIINTVTNEEKSVILRDDWVVDIDFNSFNEIEEEIDRHDSGKYYNTIVDNNSLILSYNHDFNSLKNSTLLLKCFDKVSVFKTGDNIYISTSDGFTCFDEYETFDSIRVVIETDGNVVSNNANEVEGNKYIWNFNRNKRNGSINITIEKSEEQPSSSSSSSTNNNSDNSDKRSNSYYIFILILFVLLGIGYLVYRYLKNEGDNNNKI